MLIEFVSQQSEGKRRPIDGDVKLTQEVGECTNMVFMPMREHHCFQVTFLAQIAKVRKNDIDPKHFALREHRATINRNSGNILAAGRAILDQHQIETDLAEPPEGD